MHLAHDQALRQKQAQPEAGLAEEIEPGEPAVFDLLAQAPMQAASVAKRLEDRHGDTWLRDLIEGAQGRAGAGEAFSDLEQAEGAGRRGDPAAERDWAARAFAGFQAAHNAAGALRARYELLYSYQRSSEARACLDLGTALSSALERVPYPWLRAQTLLERASCANMAGDFHSADSWTLQAIAESQSRGFAKQRLRGIGIRAVALNSMGDWARAWELDLDGLRTFWSGSFPPARAYQFYYTLGNSAQDHGYVLFARALAEEAVEQVARTGNLSTEAMARMRLANLDLSARDEADAKAEVTRVAHLFDRLPPGKEKELYRADGEIGLARVQAREGDPRGALIRLENVGRDVAGVSNQNVAVSLFRAKAEIERQLGDQPAAEQALRALANVAEVGLSSLPRNDERLIWVHELDGAYRGLVRASLDRGDSSAALDLWESYRAADSRPAAARSAKADIASLERADLPFPAMRSRDFFQHVESSVVLTYVQMSDGVASWRSDRKETVYRWIPVPQKALSMQVARFVQECARPDHGDREVVDQGRRLFDLLVRPFWRDLAAGQALVIDADGPAAQIPFEALTTPEGHYLGELRNAIMTPGIYFFREQPFSPAGMTGPALVVGSPLLDAADRERFPPLPDAAEEASEVAALFPNHLLLTGAGATRDAVREDLPKATFFHFAGHALSSPVQAGLVLAGRGGGGADFWDARAFQDLRLQRCRLAVLSACGTSAMNDWGLAEPENLARALLRAGVAHVVASRWPVDSKVTRALMTRFYSGLRQGQSVAGALRGAQAVIRGSAGTSHPYYWSAFSAFGSL